MSTLSALKSSQKYAIDRLCRETGCSREESATAYISSQNLFEPAKALLLKGKETAVVVAPPPVVETTPTPKPQTSSPPPRPPRKPPVSPPPDPNSLRVRMPNGETLRVVRLPDDYVATSRAAWEKKKQDEETDGLLAVGNTITRALDLCSRLANRAADKDAERIML
jgi:hypothetical protein